MQQFAAHPAGGHEVGKAQALGLVVLPQRFGLDAFAGVGLVDHRGDGRCHQRAAPHQPGVPDPVEVHAQRHGFHARALTLARGQGLFEQRQDATLHGEVAAQVSQPADLEALE